jgi:hypothetical protein
MSHRRLLLLSLLLLSSCGGGGGGGDTVEVSVAYAYLSPYHPSWPGSLAYVEVSDGVAYLHLRDDIDQTATPWWPILAHELWHVAGYLYHLEPPCVASTGDGLYASQGAPCDQELAMLAVVAGTIEVHCGGNQELYLATFTAAEYWNGHLGHQLFKARYE